MEILPEVSGLNFLVICFLSFFKSRISFKIYVADASKPKDKNPKIKLNSIFSENSCCDAIKGKKISKFFIQWCKRRTSIILIIHIN